MVYKNTVIIGLLQLWFHGVCYPHKQHIQYATASKVLWYIYVIYTSISYSM